MPFTNVKQLHIYTARQECHTEIGIPIDTACKLLQIAQPAYNKWASGKLSRRGAVNEDIAKKVERIQLENPDKGYRRIKDDLQHDHGIHVNDKRQVV